MHKAVSSYLGLLLDDISDVSAFSQEDIGFIQACLCHQPERAHTIRDYWGNWDYPYDDLPYTRPYLDEHVIAIMKAKGIRQRQLWPDGKKFAIHISHDVDFVALNDIRQVIRATKKGLVTGAGKLRLAYDLLTRSTKAAFGKKEENLDFARWTDALQEHNFRSTFYYFPQPSRQHINNYDSDYLLSDDVYYGRRRMSVAGMIRAMEGAGFEIGLHGSYNSYTNPEILRQQKEQLDKVTSNPVVSSRQHYLHFDINKTPETQVAAGLQVDATLGFNRAIGFRAGTAFPYLLSGADGNALPLIEVPMHVMDGALFLPNSLELDEAFAIKRSLEMMDRVANVGGCLSINFHPHFLNNAVWWNTFIAIIKEAAARGAHCILAKEFINLFDR